MSMLNEMLKAAARLGITVETQTEHTPAAGSDDQPQSPGIVETVELSTGVCARVSPNKNIKKSIVDIVDNNRGVQALCPPTTPIDSSTMSTDPTPSIKGVGVDNSTMSTIEGFRWWSPADGLIGHDFAFDTETAPIERPWEAPELVLATASADGRAYLLRRTDLQSFWQIHRCARCVYLHNAAFDLRVIAPWVDIDIAAMLEAGQIIDTAMLFRLCELAEKGVVPRRGYALDDLAAEQGIHLDKDPSVRLGFGKCIRSDGTVDYDAITDRELCYAITDADATERVGRVLVGRANDLAKKHGGSDPLLSLRLQVMADWALARVTETGLDVDRDTLELLEAKLQKEQEVLRATLVHHGYEPGQGGNSGQYQRIMKEIEKMAGVRLARSAKEKSITAKATELAVVRNHPFVEAYLQFKANEKLLSTFVAPLRQGVGRAHPRYETLLRTGRTSATRPAIQTVPRKGGLRECIVPQEGHTFVSADYAALELCTLAQYCYGKFGWSDLRRLINDGADLHRYVAAQILGKTESEVTDEERQRSKAVNFGIPGALGPPALVEYARDSFGVGLELEDAKRMREGVLNLFPDIRTFLDELSNVDALRGVVDFSTYPGPPEYAPYNLIRVLGGHSATSKGRTFSDPEVDWIWNKAAELAELLGRPNLHSDIGSRKGSKELQRALVPPFVAMVPSGRIRSGCTFAASRNCIFQGMAADGAKLALFNLVRAGFRVCAFVHDEFVVEVPRGSDQEERAQQIVGIMTESMQVVCPDVKISVKWRLADRWGK